MDKEPLSTFMVSSPLMFGISESPLYVDGKIITTPGGSKGFCGCF